MLLIRLYREVEIHQTTLFSTKNSVYKEEKQERQHHSINGLTYMFLYVIFLAIQTLNRSITSFVFVYLLQRSRLEIICISQLLVNIDKLRVSASPLLQNRVSWFSWHHELQSSYKTLKMSYFIVHYIHFSLPQTTYLFDSNFTQPGKLIVKSYLYDYKKLDSYLRLSVL